MLLCMSASFAAVNGGQKLVLLLLLLLLLSVSVIAISSVMAGVLFLVVPFGFGNSQQAPLDRPSSIDSLHPVLPGKHPILSTQPDMLSHPKRSHMPYDTKNALEKVTAHTAGSFAYA